jgi:predicted DNA-binding protein
MHIHFDQNIQSQLHNLAIQNGQSEDFFVVQAVNNYLDDIADIELAKQILSQKNKTYSQDEVERELGFDFSVKH